jgi:hypothetical protein
MGYGDWLREPKKKYPKINDINNVAGGGTGIEGANVQNVSSGYGNWLNKGTVQPVPELQRAIPAIENVPVNPTGSYSNWLNNGTVSTPEVQPVTGAQVTPITRQRMRQATSPVSAITEASAPTTTPTTAQTPSTASVTPTEHVETYAEYLSHGAEPPEYLQDDNAKVYDEKNKEALAEIDKIVAEGGTNATTPETTPETSQNGTNKMMEAAEASKNLSYESAEKARAEAERAADVARQRAVADANAAYAQNKAEYGAKAEAMGNMGLTGGGYSDWLNASAYAQNRSDVQIAQAKSDAAKSTAKYNEEQAKLAADIQYNNQKYTTEEKNLALYEQLLRGVSDGTYTLDDAKALANAFGFSEEWTNSVINSANNYNDKIGKEEEDIKTEQNRSDYTNILIGASNGTYDEATASALAKEYGLTDDQTTAIINAAKGHKGEKTGDSFVDLLVGASNGSVTKEVAAAIAKHYGLTDDQLDAIKGAADAYNTKIGNEEEKSESQQKTSNFIGLLASANSGELTAADLAQIATELGLSDEQKKLLEDAAGRYEDSSDEAKAASKSANFAALLDGANSGAYTAEQIEELAKMFGFDETEDEKLITTLKTAADAYKTAQDNAKAEANDEVKKNVYINLLDAANRGGYTETQIENLAKMYELTDDQVSELKTAAQNYATENADAIAKDKSTQKSMTFVELLNGANSGAYSEAQIAELAKMFGFSETEDEGLITILKNAAKAYADGELEYDEQQRSATFVELLNGANSGAYNADQISQLASMFGFNINDEEDANLIKMLQKAANAFDSEETANELKNDKQYQNGVYAELLSGVNTGAYTGAQAADLANRFGLDKDAQDALVEAGEIYLSNKETEEKEAKEGDYVYNKNVLKQQVTSDTTDEEIQSWLDDDLIDADGANSLKEHRKIVAVKELDELIKSGDLESAAERADELYERGVIGTDAYQKTYLDKFVANIKFDGADTIENLKTLENDLKIYLDSRKISQKDYNNALKYLYQSAFPSVDSFKYVGDLKYQIGTQTISGVIASPVMNDYNGGALYDEILRGHITSFNNAVSSGTIPEYGSLLYGGNVYFKDGKGTWYVISPLGSDNQTLIGLYRNALASVAAPTAPTHASDTVQVPNTPVTPQIKN